MIKQVNIQNSTVDLIFYIVDKCNYVCEYCYNAQPRTGFALQKSAIWQSVKYVFDKCNMPICIQLIAGEPTLYVELFDLYSDLDSLDYVQNILIYSNFSQPYKIYEKILANKKHSVFLSWHSQNKEFVQKALQLKQYESQIQISLMYEHGYTNYVISLFDKLQLYFRLINLHMIDEDKNAYTQYEIEQFKTHNKDFTTQLVLDNGNIINLYNYYFYLDENTFCFKNWLCEAGNKLLYIHVDGNIFQCPDFYYRKHMPIGNIYSNCIKSLTMKKTLCPFSKCTCGHDYVKYNIFKKNDKN